LTVFIRAKHLGLWAQVYFYIQVRFFIVSLNINAILKTRRQKMSKFDLGAWKLPDEITTLFKGQEPLILEIFGPINQMAIDHWIDNLSLVRVGQPLLMLFNSSGGSSAGRILINCIHLLKVPVIALAVGQVSSMALMVYLSVPKEHRFSLPSATFVAHRGKGATQLNGSIDLKNQTINNLDQEEAIRLLGLSWRNIEEAEEELHTSLIAVMGETIDIGGDEPISIDEFLRYDIAISAELAQKIGFVHQIVSS